MLSKKIMLGVSGLLAGLLFTTGCARREPAPPTSCVPRIVEPASLQQMRYPTARDWLAGPERSAAFQPTASGRPESALYGSVRTVQLGRRWVASFHEGVDIAPLHRDRLGRPCDTIHAVAEGRVAYLNRLAGQSSYGKYVVLVHASSVGELYTLYAHLAHITPTLQTGQT
ncbi:MAG: M23 family metallopeptidase, partial [Lentisphaerae bacterium]|nr:M23 family metallopeptidase [Lentisphaerota bacterium]